MCRFINKPFSFWKKEKRFRKRKTSYGERNAFSEKKNILQGREKGGDDIFDCVE